VWDKRYSTDEYVYGTEPNKFLKNNFNFIPKGEGLSLAEGEGRNAVPSEAGVICNCYRFIFSRYRSK
jgi:hypothetical protein